MLCEPPLSEGVEKLACNKALSVSVPSVVAPSMKVTVPVGTVTLVGAASECVRRARLIRTYSIAAAAAGSDAVTVAVKATDWVSGLGFGHEDSAVLVVGTWG